MTTRTRKAPAKKKAAPAKVKSPVTRGRSMTAAAQILVGKRITRVNRPKNLQGSAWQADAWDYYDRVGEFSWAVDKQAWAVSQVRLVAARDTPNQDEPDIIDAEPPEEAPQPTELELQAAELVGGFAGGTTGQQQLLRRVTTQLIVSAESYIVGRTVDGEEVWEAYSRDEVKWTQNGYRVDDGLDKFPITDDDVLIRVWLPHARKRQEPRSSTKALLPVLAEICALTSSISAQCDSRLAGAGMLIFPKSVELVGSARASDDAGDEGDSFMEEVADTMLTPIKDRDSAAAVVPIMLKVDDDAVGKIQYLRFDAPSDANDADKREKAMLRLARGMDLPPEEMMGMGDANHWGAWQIDEATIKGPISSLAAIVAHALTIGWFRPALEASFTDPTDVLPDGLAEEIAELMVWFDPAALEQRPDRSENAVAVFDRGGLTFGALARENGLSEDDIPDGQELCRVLLFRLMNAHPEMTGALLLALGPCAGITDLKGLDPALLSPQLEPAPADDQEDDTGQRSLPDRDTTRPEGEEVP